MCKGTSDGPQNSRPSPRINQRPNGHTIPAGKPGGTGNEKPRKRGKK